MFVYAFHDFNPEKRGERSIYIRVIRNIAREVALSV